MSQKIAFITGGNRGIGFQTALGLKDAGAKVVIGSRNLAKGEEAVAKLREAGVDADVLQFEITRVGDYQSAYDYFDSKYSRLDILINNAGIAAGTFPGSGPAHSAAEVPLDVLHHIFQTNFFAQVALTKTLLPLLKRSPAGRIVNLSSILASLALHSDPASPIYNAKSFAYDASKTALNAFTVHLAWDLRDTKIKVNSAHPGWVKTDMGGPNAIMELAEGAKTSIALATLPDDGPTGGFFHLGQTLPW
ncbi:MAG: SDR family oxidoreductase [Terracidiphilus sp.]|jgi:NAD(P)-dependent dehydrogenase (short-subunit alcohol dehydrogenase family)